MKKSKKPNKLDARVTDEQYKLVESLMNEKVSKSEAVRILLDELIALRKLHKGES